MNAQKKRGLKRRGLCLLLAPMLGLGVINLWRAADTWHTALMQDRLYVRNESSEPVAKVRIWFSGYGMRPSRELVFCNVPGGGEQWQLFGPEWGNLDSSRSYSIKGVMDSGKRIGSDKSRGDASYVMGKPLLGGARFYVVVLPDGKLHVQPNK
jgi:hypothetical protein